MDLDKEELKATKKNREKTADEMFEELGYVVKKENKNYIRYKKEEYYGEEIAFETKTQRVRKMSKGSGNPVPVYMTVEELIVINQFYKEKGWLDEK